MQTLRLALVLARFRMLHLRNGLLRVPGARATRVMAGLTLLIPLAYLGLFASAFAVLGQRAGLPVQLAAVAVFCTALALASLLGKIAASDAITAGTPENEFLLARPVALGRLLVARALSALLLDFWGALFLLPALAAAALTLKLGVAGCMVALAMSVLAQVIVVALAQTVLVTLIRLVPGHRRRGLWTLLALLSALVVAGLWIVASATLRRPDDLIGWLSPHAAGILGSPLGVFAWPLSGLLLRDAAPVVLGFGLLLALVAAALGLCGLAGRLASRRGWEDAGVAVPFGGIALAAAGTLSGGPRFSSRVDPGRRALSVAGKDVRLLLRDRARLVTLLAMPLVFVGIQIFGAAGLGFLREQPNRIAIVAYSICAYLAVIGPLPHMQAERRAFWILRTVPQPLHRLMRGKAMVWGAVIGGLAVLSFVALAFWIGGSEALTIANLRFLLLTSGGALLVSLLAVAMGCHAADLTRPGRAAVGPVTIYTFLMIAALWNVVLLQEGDVVWRAAALYLAALGLYFYLGIERATDCLDPEAVARRSSSAADGVAAAILLFLGTHAAELGSGAAGVAPEERQAVVFGWSTLIAIAAAAELGSGWRTAARKAGPALGRRYARAGIAGLTAVLVVIGWRAMSDPLTPALGVTWRGLTPFPAGNAIVVLAEELVFRGLIQQPLLARWGASRGQTAAALLFSLVIGLHAAGGPLAPVTVAAHLVAALACYGGRSVASGVAARFAWLV